MLGSRLLRLRHLGLVTALALLAAPAAAAGSQYSVAAITGPGATIEQGNALNAGGDVVGLAKFGTSVPCGFLWHSGVLSALPSAYANGQRGVSEPGCNGSGSGGTEAWDLNHSELIAGSADYEPPPGTRVTQAATWQGTGPPSSLGAAPATAFALSAAGTVVGATGGATGGAWLGSPSNTIAPSSPTSGGKGDALGIAINGVGQVVVYYDGAGTSGPPSAALYPGLTSLPVVPTILLNGRAGRGGAGSLNDSSVVVGGVVSGSGPGGTLGAAYSQNAGPAVNLPPILGMADATASAINDEGDVVGASFSGTSASVATIWPHAAPPASGPVPTGIDLNTLLPANAGITLQTAVAINATGQILAEGTAGGSPEWVVLTPPGDGVTISSGNAVPEPATGSVPATFTIALPAAQTSDTTITYRTIDGTAKVSANDYTAVANGSTTIPAGQTTAQVQVQIDNGSGQTTTETKGFQVQLTSSTGPPISATGGIAPGIITASALGGTLTDDQGKGLTGVQVKLTGTASSGQSVSQQTTTDASGKYQFYADPGTYTVKATPPAPGPADSAYAASNCPGTVQPGACANIALNPSANLTADFTGLDKLIFYVNYASSNAAFTGHVFVQFRTAGQPIFTVGKYPGTYAPFVARGTILDGSARFSDDGQSLWSHRIVYSVTHQQYTAALGYANGQISAANGSDAGEYKLLGENCMDFLIHVATAAGLTLPASSDILAVGYSDPRAFDASLTAAGNGATVDGGLVEPGDGSTALGAPDPPTAPEFDSPVGLIDEALADPAGEASALGFRRDSAPLSPVSVIAGGSVTLSETGALPAGALYGVIWGDGTAPNLADVLPGAPSPSAPALHHSYAAAGTYSETLVVLQSGALEEYTGTVTVASAGSPSASQSYTVPGAAANFEFPAGPESQPTYSPGAPSAPPSAHASPGDGSATITWTGANGNGNTVTSYLVTASPGGASTTVNGSTTTATLPGLQNGTLYTFTVSAVNSIGAGPPVTASATPAGSTGPPSASISSPADGASFTRGQAVNARYSCTSGAGATLRSCAGPSANGAPIDTSTTGPHTFTVTATDTDGHSTSVTHGYTVSPVKTTPTSLTAAPQFVLFPPPTGIGFGRVRATLTGAGQPLAGMQIMFSVGVTRLCSATTSANGTASCSLPLKAEFAVLVANRYTASFSGDVAYLGSSASTPAFGLGTGARGTTACDHATDRGGHPCPQTRGKPHRITIKRVTLSREQLLYATASSCRNHRMGCVALRRRRGLRAGAYVLTLTFAGSALRPVPEMLTLR